MKIENRMDHTNEPNGMPKVVHVYLTMTALGRDATELRETMEVGELLRYAPIRAVSTQPEIQQLNAAIADAQAQIADCRRQWASEEEMLQSLLKERRTSANEDYLDKAKNACRLGIKAWEMSIRAFQNDINRYQSQIDLIRQQGHLE